MVKDNGSYVSLENMLIDAKINEHNLFLAAEQGAGKYQNNVTVVINPKIKENSRKWLVEEYLKLKFSTEIQLITSVDPEKYRVDSKYNKSLKEFLKPIIQQVDLNNNKFGKKLKTYA